MGLAGPKNKRKLAKDPNNTAWSNNTSRFGHRVLVSQGWAPGNHLGSADAKYASDHHTAASSSHIRVSLRDGNMGVGAVRGKTDAETFGLDLLSGLLGRLNGKTDQQLDKEEAARRDVRLQRYQSDKFGMVGFVFGGYLIGDDIKKTVDTDEMLDETKVPTKRKRQAAPESSGAKDVPMAELKGDSEEASASEKKKRKQEKKARKEAKRLRKEQRALKKLQTETGSNDTMETTDNKVETPITSNAPSGASTPVSAMFRGRQAIRHRYIQQKKMASLDAKALNEIFMIKPT